MEKSAGVFAIIKYQQKVLNCFIFFFLHVKMANKYYQKHKEKLQKEARERYQNISEKEKEKKASLSSDEENFDEEN